MVPGSILLPIFSLLRRSVLDLGSGTGQTDGQTMGPIGAGHNNYMECFSLPKG